MHTGIFDAGQPWTSWCFAAKESFLLSADSPAAHDALLEPVTVPHTADIKHLALNQAPRGFVAPQHLTELPQPIFQGPWDLLPAPGAEEDFYAVLSRGMPLGAQLGLQLVPLACLRLYKPCLSQLGMWRE